MVIATIEIGDPLPSVDQVKILEIDSVFLSKNKLITTVVLFRFIILQLRATMREWDLAVSAVLADRRPIEAQSMIGVLSDVKGKIAALLTRASPLGASKQRAKSLLPYEAFLAEHSVESAMSMLMPVVAALPTHAARCYAQLAANLVAERAEQRFASGDRLVKCSVVVVGIFFMIRFIRIYS